jgi:hypothetical protein
MSLIVEKPSHQDGAVLRTSSVLYSCISLWGLALAATSGMLACIGIQCNESWCTSPSVKAAIHGVLVLAAAYGVRAFIVVPPTLAHLPRAPLIPIFLSVLRGEPDDVRYKQLLLPLLDDSEHGVVLVWMLGRWIVHVLDWNLGRVMAENAALEKESPPDGMLLWDLIGRRNFIFANGPLWRRHAAIIKRGFEGPVPMDILTHQSRLLFGLIGRGGRLHASEWSQRYALAVVGNS